MSCCIKGEDGGIVGENAPGPLWGIGQNILDKYSLAPLEILYHQQTLDGHVTTVFNELLYGITDRLSLLCVVPVVVNNVQSAFHDHGIGDVALQLEHAFYAEQKPGSRTRATVIGSVIFPSAPLNTIPYDGTGVWSFFTGYTLSHSNECWYYFISSGGLITTTRQELKPSNIFLYEGGVARTLAVNKNMHLSVLLEGNGVYVGHATQSSIVDKNSGFNVFFLGPTVRCLYKQCLTQIGIQFPITQHFFGNQIDFFDYRAAFYATWTFSF